MTSATTYHHRGGQLGLFALLCMLAMTSCTGLMQQSPSGAMSWLPGWAKVKEAQNNAVLAQAVTVNQSAATFIVRFDNEPVLDEVCKTFRRDGAGARAKFSSWSSRHPELAGLTLSRASYSGELVLALPRNDPRGRTPQQVLAALQRMDNLVYAEIDAIAHPGSGK